MTHVDLAKETEQNELTEQVGVEARKSAEDQTGECIVFCIDSIVFALTCWF